MNELEAHIRQLIQETCQHPRGSLERQKGLNEIIFQIQQSGKLWQGVGEPNREDALQETWLYFCRNLCEATTGDRFDPERASVITWLNVYFKYRLSDSRRKFFQDSINDQDPLIHLAANPDPPPILEDIREWLQTEGSNLRRIHVRSRPDINCQALIEYRLPPEITWEELAQKYGVAIATLSNFYQRECFPRLLNFGKSQGYLISPDE